MISHEGGGHYGSPIPEDTVLRFSAACSDIFKYGGLTPQNPSPEAHTPKFHMTTLEKGLILSSEVGLSGGPSHGYSGQIRIALEDDDFVTALFVHEQLEGGRPSQAKILGHTHTLSTILTREQHWNSGKTFLTLEYFIVTRAKRVFRAQILERKGHYIKQLREEKDPDVMTSWAEYTERSAKRLAETYPEVK